MARLLPVLTVIFSCMAIFQSIARADDLREVYVVFIDPTLPSTRDVHLEYLKKIVEGITPAEALVYSYHTVITGFSARLTDTEAKKLEKLEGIKAVEPSKKLHIEGSWQLPEKLFASPAPF